MFASLPHVGQTVPEEPLRETFQDEKAKVFWAFPGVQIPSHVASSIDVPPLTSLATFSISIAGPWLGRSRVERPYRRPVPRYPGRRASHRAELVWHKNKEHLTIG